MFGQCFHKSKRLLAACCSLYLAGCMAGKSFTRAGAHAPTAWVEACVDWDDWNKPSPPFRLYGNSYYVGTCGITAILIAGPEGHILIDGGTEAGAEIIAENIRALGYSLDDVKLLLHSHEHFDHVAGLAKLQKLTNARLLASPEAAPVIRTGIVADHDPQAGMHKPFPAARVDGIVKAGDTVSLGQLSLTPIASPGHTHGALSWQWTSCEQGRCIAIVYADSLSPISSDTYRFSDHPDYVNSYQEGLNKLAALDCQMLIAPHPSASHMRERLSTSRGLYDPEACKIYADDVSTRLKERLTKERHRKAN
jgi:metallo-beta-lactamase class B